MVAVGQRFPMNPSDLGIPPSRTSCDSAMPLLQLPCPDRDLEFSDPIDGRKVSHLRTVLAHSRPIDQRRGTGLTRLTERGDQILELASAAVNLETRKPVLVWLVLAIDVAAALPARLVWYVPQSGTTALTDQMLRPRSFCRCPSTSTARPSCLHVRRSLSSAPPDRPARPPTPAQSDAPVTRTAKQSDWFTPSAKGWQSWIVQSRSSASNSELEAPPTDAYFVPAVSLAAPVVPIVSLEEQKFGRNSSMALVKKYLALRSSSHSFLRLLPPATIQTLLRHTQMYSLPLVEKFLVEDLKNLRLSQRTKLDEPEVADQVDAKPADGLDVELSERVALEMAQRRDEVPLPPRRTNRKSLDAVSVDSYDRDNFTQILMALDRTAARRLLREVVDSEQSIDVLPASLTRELGDLEATEKLETLWRNFIAKLDESLAEDRSEETEMEDFKLSLAFLLKITLPAPSTADPSIPSASSAAIHLPLALKILRFLVTESAISPSSLASTPAHSDVPLPRDVTFRLVLLRTIAKVATEESFHALAIEALSGALALRRDFLVAKEHEDDYEENEELDLLVGTFEEIMRDVHRRTATSYTLTLDSPTAALLAHASTLLTSHLPALFSPLPRTLPRPANALLASFAAQVHVLERYDLLETVWGIYREGELSWLSIPARIELLRWFAGQQGVEAYLRLGRMQEGMDRPVVTASFRELAAATYLHLKDAPSPSASQQLELLTLLLNTRAYSGATTDLAVRIYKLFRSSATPLRPFAVNGGVLLSLVRASTPSTGGTSNVLFASSIINDFVVSLTSPASPFSHPDRHIDRVDLTTLAQAYAIVGDLDSTGQVYRKMLDQKMLPDLKDMLVVLDITSTQDSARAVSHLKLAWRTGIVIGKEMVEVVMKRSVEKLRREDKETRGTVLHIVQVARECGLPQGQLKKLLELGFATEIGTGRTPKHLKKGLSAPLSREFTLPPEVLYNYLSGTPTFPPKNLDTREISTSKLNRMVHKAAREKQWNTALDLYWTALERGGLDDRSPQIVLEEMVGFLRTGGGMGVQRATMDKRSVASLARKRKEVKLRIMKFIDHILADKIYTSPPPPSSPPLLPSLNSVKPTPLYPLLVQALLELHRPAKLLRLLTLFPIPDLATALGPALTAELLSVIGRKVHSWGTDSETLSGLESIRNDLVHWGSLIGGEEDQDDAEELADDGEQYIDEGEGAMEGEADHFVA